MPEFFIGRRGTKAEEGAPLRAAEDEMGGMVKAIERGYPQKEIAESSYQYQRAVEAKENVPVQEESRTMATITFQNLFRIYKKLAGMTGTADTEAAEFQAGCYRPRRQCRWETARPACQRGPSK